MNDPYRDVLWTELVSIDEPDMRRHTRVNVFCREAIDFAVQTLPYGGLIVTQLREEGKNGSGVHLLWRIVIPFLVPMMTAVFTAAATSYVTLQVTRVELQNLERRVEEMNRQNQREREELRKKDDQHDAMLLELYRQQVRK